MILVGLDGLSPSRFCQVSVDGQVSSRLRCKMALDAICCWVEIHQIRRQRLHGILNNSVIRIVGRSPQVGMDYCRARLERRKRKPPQRQPRFPLMLSFYASCQRLHAGLDIRLHMRTVQRFWWGWLAIPRNSMIVTGPDNRPKTY